LRLHAALRFCDGLFAWIALVRGLAAVPVVLADELSEKQIKAFRLLANRSRWRDIRCDRGRCSDRTRTD
jgi:hypothetical protein